MDAKDELHQVIAKSKLGKISSSNQSSDNQGDNFDSQSRTDGSKILNNRPSITQPIYEPEEKTNNRLLRNLKSYTPYFNKLNEDYERKQKEKQKKSEDIYSIKGKNPEQTANESNENPKFQLKGNYGQKTPEGVPQASKNQGEISPDLYTRLNKLKNPSSGQQNESIEPNNQKDNIKTQLQGDYGQKSDSSRIRETHNIGDFTPELKDSK
ncbi:hypothetical protein [Aerosakkonema funiforme]|uniref:hypothetical protein n=1 Tax=Aerosakkonema funiforme TaxID=1246630 RepID=UPI0035BACF0F